MKHFANGWLALLVSLGMTSVLSAQELVEESDMRAQDAAAAPSVLAILAHPDDEITIAPVLARIAREGGDVALVFATSGDAGPGVSDLEPGADLAAFREDEARCSAFALGLSEPTFWQMGDGALSPGARAPESPARKLAENVEEAIAEMRPRIVMTWGPDGGYGHADHRMVSAVVTQVVQEMGEDRPDLLYAALPSDRLPQIAQFERWASTHPSLITDRIGYEPVDLGAAEAAIGCHESQFDDAARELLPQLLHETVWRGTVSFRLAFVPAH
ncbi:MAG: PIG-L family deacetylase [Erythrobacter sp.]|uniref:PIG-L deacetylase family protein n=1 Tax=Erythrobacter sp. TaxID=1042 RepID=UPI003C78CCDB